MVTFLSFYSEAESCPTKLLCYTRSSPLITQKVPVQYPNKLYANEVDFETYHMTLEELVYDDPRQLVVCKLTSSVSLSNFEKLLQHFTQKKSLNVFLIIANMQDVSRNIKKVVNHVRIMIERAESQSQCRGKLFVVLLHFPPVMFFDACYPSLFLRGWDHHYLDTIAHNHIKGTNLIRSPLDIELWFKCLCLPDGFTRGDDRTVVVALSALQEEAIPVITSRVCFGSQGNSQFNRPMDGIERSKSIRNLLKDKGVGDILCARFSTYWKPKVIIEYIRQAAEFTYNHESSLSLTDSVQTAFKSLFFDFMVYMISQMNTQFSIDLLYGTESPWRVEKLFLDILAVMPVPNLSKLQARSSSLTPPVLVSGNGGYCSQFPFFSYVFQALESLMDKCRELVNQQLEDPLDEQLRQTMFSREQLLSKFGMSQFHKILQV